MSVPELKDSAQENLGGRLIGNYELLRELGRGAMGVVYKAHESSLNRMVALKVLPQHLARDEAFLKRFHREARTVAQLNHPNVVTIFNIGADDGIHYIAMEYVKGKALSDIIQEEGQLEIRRALEIARQVAGALDAAHQMKIIHRDIKPHNIMVDELGRAKVLDFGIAKVQEEKPTGLTHTGQVLGTPHYMAPEQCRGLEIDGRTDIYSLGVSLYEMLAGSLPFTGHTAVVVIQKILFEEPTPLGQFNGVVPPSVIHIINKSIARERDDRYQSAADFEEALRRAIIEMDRRSSLDPHERATNFESDRIPIEESTGFLRQLPRVFRSKRNRMTAGGVGAAVLFTMIFALAFRPAPKNQDESAPETSAPSAATPPSQENPPPSPPATTHSIPSDAGLPQIQWLAAPEEGATISAKSVSLAWQSLSATPPEKYLVGFNAPEPATNLTQTSATFELQNPGAQSVVIIPLGADGLRGRAIERHFVYQPPPDPIREAVALYTGTGGAVDESRAKEIILRASKEVDPLAQMWLGWFLHWGRCGFPKDIDEAVKLSQSAIGSVRSLAESGNADAQFLLGAAFDQGIGIEANPAGAIRWVTQSAEAGQTVAMNYLGWMYVEGRGAPKDNTAAIAWFSRAADLGDTGAMHNLGWMLADGKGVPKDEAKAVEWFRKGAELGSARNMGNLGIFYNKGRGVPKDANAAIEWFQKAARLGDETSQKNLKTLGKEW